MLACLGVIEKTFIAEGFSQDFYVGGACRPLVVLHSELDRFQRIRIFFDNTKMRCEEISGCKPFCEKDVDVLRWTGTYPYALVK